MEDNSTSVGEGKPKKGLPWGIIIIVLIIVVVGGMFYASGDNDNDDGEFAGIHIMEDGGVMLGDGEMVEGAEVTADGMIKLPNGEVIEPVMDLREGGSMGDMMMEEDDHMHKPGTPDDHPHN